MNGLASWRELVEGGAIVGGATSRVYRTGSWRTLTPKFNKDACKNCLLCWIFCADGAVKVNNREVIGIDYDFCKGCGICAVECPAKAIHMEKV